MNSPNLHARAGSLPTSTQLGWRSIVNEDWRLILIGAIASFFLASLITSGAPAGFIPDLSVPFGYNGDSIFHAWMANRVDEGWIFNNARSGYPFGSNFLDYPGADAGNHLVIKLLSGLTGGWVGGLNLYYLLGFPTCFVASYITSRAFGLNRSFSMAVALLYSFTPFHFLRLIYQHLFYTWYFVVPVFFYLALSVYRAGQPPQIGSLPARITKAVPATLGLFILASFGVYYAVFGVIVIALAGLLSWVNSKHLQGLKKSILLSCAIGAGVALNVAPNVINTYTNGANEEAAQRSPGQSEHLGFKLMQLMLPRLDHRSSALANLTQVYNNSSPLINENATATLGMIGAGGLVLVFFFLLFKPSGAADDERLRLVAAITFVLFMFGTIGGLGTVFAWIVSPSIRGWNRISVFIAFSTVLFTFIALQILLKEKAPRLARYAAAIAAVALLFGLLDQTVPACKSCYVQRKAEFENDKHFVQSIESELPPGAAVYQLPYFGFPEEPPMNRMMSYQSMAGVIHSKGLHWSFGGMKGRDGDAFYRALAKESTSKQLSVIRQLGFDGIYIDRRGYADNGDALISELTELLQSTPQLVSSSGDQVFFRVTGSQHRPLEHLSPAQIMKLSGYYVDHNGIRYPSTLENGIDFTREGWPEFIANVKGVWPLESWGRWSVKPEVTLDFTEPLPQKFTLILKARAFASNAQHPTRIRVADREYTAQLTGDTSEVRVEVDLQGSSTNRITFIPHAPTSPRKIMGGSDDRMLGIGFVSMRIEQ
ncbi:MULTISPECIES: DUF7024 domain-containing protein [unclassified Pseudomonas]|uniref:DUF7024 domain-containing protein n=1 Tax=unclassified Pseudomonas TaxID=196821 RepID=UPI00381C0C82